jgi:hypothetical protein
MSNIQIRFIPHYCTVQWFVINAICIYTRDVCRHFVTHWCRNTLHWTENNFCHIFVLVINNSKQSVWHNCLCIARLLDSVYKPTIIREKMVIKWQVDMQYAARLLTCLAWWWATFRPKHVAFKWNHNCVGSFNILLNILWIHNGINSVKLAITCLDISMEQFQTRSCHLH